MAVYKATYCYPFLNSFDGRVTATLENSTPAQYLKCKIETSNKNVTGYSIEILDLNNNKIFPYNGVTKISPILELPQNLGNEVNIGSSGTYLHIPFFQNWFTSNRVASADNLPAASHNAVYYIPQFKAHYILGTSAEFIGVDNVNNWSYDSSTQELYFEGFTGILNEEMVSENEIVFVSKPSSDVGGLWKIQKSGRLIQYNLPGSPSTEIDIAYIGDHNSKITITNGYYHDRTYAPVLDEQQDVTSFELYTGALWCDCEGNPINLTNDAGSYKWTITLYQSPELGYWNNRAFVPDYRKESIGILKDNNGTNIDIDHISITHDHPWYCDYSSLSTYWYDMTLNSGTILGSTKDRIQISDLSESYIPGDDSIEPVVLQGRYVQLYSNDSLTESISTRAYITSYDASYGHIYPHVGSFTNDLIGTSDENVISAGFVQIYKYSNDPDSVTANDTVTVATVNNISDFSNVLRSIDRVIVNQGDYVLVCNQTDPKQNGVYVVDSINSGSSCTLVRSGAYKEWGDFIGKVFFVKNGSTYRYKNFISQARAGGRLYVSGETPTGDSPLTFTEEQPLLLFPNLINRTVTFASIFGPSFDPESTDTSFDGIGLKKGDTLLDTNDNVIYIYDPDAVGNKWSAKENLDETQFIGNIQISYGKLNGGKYYYIGADNDHLTTEPCTAKVLKNTKTKTYIKPFTGLDTKMILVFKNNQKVTYNDLTQKNYLFFTAIDTKLWSVTHEELLEPLQSWGEAQNSNNIPFSYDIKSFHKISDENPFFLYDDPYLKLGTGNGGYSDITTYVPYFVKENIGDFESSQYFCVVENEEEHSFFYVKAPSITALTSRSITLQGHYYQWQQGSWESYRWILTDFNGNILQDTGKKYDHSMMVTFYGLSNESSNYNNYYYAVLLVEDSLGETLSFSMQLIVDPSSVTTAMIPFYAEYDCNTHSVILSYQTNAFIKPSIILYPGATEALAYVKDNALLPNWDSSLIYGDVPTFSSEVNQNYLFVNRKGWMDILGKFSAESDEVYNLIQQRNYLSNTEQLGVNYQYYFERRAQTQDSSTHFLSVIDKEDNTDGEFSLQTVVKLSDNFCSNILEAAVDYGDAENQLHIQLSLPLNFESLDSDVLNNSRKGIMYKIFTDESESNNAIQGYLLKDSEGNLYQWRQSPVDSCYFLQESELNSGDIWSESIRNYRYSPILAEYGKNREFLHYDSFTHEEDLDSVYYPFFINITDKDGNQAAINTTKFLGNTCLVCQEDLALCNLSGIHEYKNYILYTSDDQSQLSWDESKNFFLRYAPCYWTEDRPQVKLYQKGALVQWPMNFLYNSNDLTYSEETGALISWPEDSNESDYYWQEGGELPSPSLENMRRYRRWRLSPYSWNVVLGKTNTWNGKWGHDSAHSSYWNDLDIAAQDIKNYGWKKLQQISRNYGWLEDYSFRLTVRVFNIETLAAASQEDVIATGNVEEDGSYVTTLSIDGTDIISFTVAKIDDKTNTNIVSN